MALTLSNSHYQPKDSKGYYVYALRRDSEDMLHLTKVSTASTTETFDPLEQMELKWKGLVTTKIMWKKLLNKNQQATIRKINTNRFVLIDETLIIS